MQKAVPKRSSDCHSHMFLKGISYGLALNARQTRNRDFGTLLYVLLLQISTITLAVYVATVSTFNTFVL